MTTFFALMQVMPATSRYVNEVLSGHNLKVRSMDGNVHLGVMYLRRMLDIMPNVKKALAAYYSGPGNVGRHLNAGQRAYARSVLALRKRF
ncbi:MAG: lytic transglycosylase domain-containing protein [Actinomycetota bacterium]